MSHHDISRIGQVVGSRQNQGRVTNPAVMSQKQYEQEIKRQIEEKKLLQMQDKLQDQKDIFNHYKHAAFGGESQDNSDPHSDLKKLIMRQEEQLANQNQRLQEQFGQGPNSFAAAKHLFTGFDQHQSKPRTNENAQTNNIPEQFLRPNYLVDNFSGPIHAPLQTAGDLISRKSQLDKEDIFGQGSANLNLAQKVENPFKTLNNETINQSNFKMDSHFGQHNFVSQQQQVTTNTAADQNERDRRIRLREQERQRRNQGLGDQGLQYGAAQVAPPMPIRPDANTNIFGEQVNVSKRDQMLAQKMAMRTSQQQFPPSNPSLDLPIHQNINMQPQYQPMQLGDLHGKVQQLSLPQQFEQPMPENSNLRKSSKSKHLMEMAKELDHSLNTPTKDNKASGFLQIGQDKVAEQRRENEKKERQAEYQAYLEKQKQGKLSPRRILERMQTLQPPTHNHDPVTASPNQNHRRLNSQNRNMPPPEQPQSQQFRRTSSQVRPQAPPSAGQLIGGGFEAPLNVNEAKQMELEEKQRKQKEYRDFLDMQSKQPAPAKMSLKPPTAPSENFIAQSKSVRDEHYLSERRKQLSDEVFSEMFNKHQEQQFQNAQQAVQSHQPVMVRRNSRVGMEGESTNFFSKAQENEEMKKQQLVDKRKEYALELQQQMAAKKNSSAQPKPPMPTSARPPAPPSQQFLQTASNFPSLNQMDLANVQLPVHLSQDERFQQILAMKREEYKKQLDQQILDKKNMDPLMPQVSNQFQAPRLDIFGNGPQQFQNQEVFGVYNPSMQQPGPSMPIQQTDIRQDSLEPPSQQQLARMRQEEYKRELDLQRQMKEQFKQPSQQTHDINVNFEQALPQGPVSGQAGNRAHRRTDITQEKLEQNNDQKNKMAAYQEELRIQMEQQKAKKEAEKAKQKVEEEILEREIQQQRKQIEARETKELIKEGKRDPNAGYKPPKAVNLQQFKTSAELAEESRVPITKKPSVIIEEPPTQYKPFTLPMNENVFGEKPQLHTQEMFLPKDEPSQYAMAPSSDPFLSRPFQTQSAFNMNMSSLAPPPMSIMPPMQQNYQFQPQASTTAMSIHEKLLEDQRKMIEMYQQALQQILEFRNQFFEEQMKMQMTLLKEREQLSMMKQFQMPQHLAAFSETSKHEQEIKQISAVRDSLNILLAKAAPKPGGHYEQHQLTSILNPDVQKNLNNFIKTQRDEVVRMSQSMSFRQQEPVYERNDAFDQSLSSNSKLISVPNQFANKLKQKAEDFELQRLTQQARAEHEQPNPYNGQNVSGLYATWNQSEQSPSRQPQFGNNQMHNSLVGSSQLQYVNQETPNHFNQRSVSPNKLVSPFSKRPLSNIADETIPELPENEQNFEGTTDYSQIKTVDHQQNINQKQNIALGGMQKSLEDWELNNRDEDISQHSKQYGRKSKVSAVSRKTHQIEQNLAFIENQVSIGAQGYQQSSQKTANQNDFRRSAQGFSPTSGSGYNQYGQGIMNQSTEKQFFKNASMNKTGMSGAPNPKMTGSSFYNATMAKTKIQEQRQQEELQRQLQQIFKDDKKHETIDVTEKEMPSEQDYRKTLEPHSNSNIFKLNAPEQSQDIENMSDINIAQSVGHSQEYQAATQKNLIDQQYNWLIKNNSNIIKEQDQESKSRDESQSLKQTMKQSEMIWNDPDLIPEMVEGSETNYHFQVKDEEEQMTEFRDNSISENSELKKIQSNRRNWQKPGTAQPYNFEENETNQSQSEINIADQTLQSVVDEVPPQININVNEFEPHKRQESKISNLRLMGNNASSDYEPLTALLVKEDATLEKLQKYNPSALGFTDERDDSQRQKQIDLMYAEKFSRPQQLQFRGLSDVKEGLDLESAGVDPYNSNFKENESIEDETEMINVIDQQNLGVKGINTKAVKDAILDSSNKEISEIPRQGMSSNAGSSLLKQERQLNSYQQSKLQSVQSYKQIEDLPARIVETNNQEAILQSKLQQIQGIFGNQEFNEPASPLKVKKIKNDEEAGEDFAQQTPMAKENQVPRFKPEQRPITQKQREIMELAQLIQEATGSINNVVESFSQNFKPLTKRKENNHQTKESVQLSRPCNINTIEQQIQEDSNNDNQIISNLDFMIQNLERQQQENERFQSKFNSNLGCVSQHKDTEVASYYDKLVEQSVGYDHFKTVMEEEDEVDQTQGTQLVQNAQNDRAAINMADLDNKQLIKRPVSGISHVSNSTRYTGVSKKKQNYEQFQEEEDEQPDTVQVNNKAKIGY